MGRQSARLLHNKKDHKDIFYNGNYHKQMWITDAEGNPTLMWEKLTDNAFEIIVSDTMYSLDGNPSTEEEYPAGTIALNIRCGETVIIDWGDGTKTNHLGSIIAHTYPTNNDTEYKVRIIGNMLDFRGSWGRNSDSCLLEIVSPLPWFSEFDITGSIDFSQFFWRCGRLRKIPINLFENYRNLEEGTVVNVDNMFWYTSIDEFLPGILFGLELGSYANMFANTKIKIVPPAAFVGVKFPPGGGSDIFRGCDIEEIYDWVSGGAAGNFSGFPNLNTINVTLSGVVNFERAFSGLKKLKTVSEYLFDGCENATSFKHAFSDSGITKIPEKLFKKCTEVKNFENCFSNCEELTDVPETIFDNCNKVESFNFCFWGDTKITSKVPELWNRQNVVGSNCYEYCFNAQNYNDIPDSWK